MAKAKPLSFRCPEHQRRELDRLVARRLEHQRKATVTDEILDAVDAWIKQRRNQEERMSFVGARHINKSLMASGPQAVHV
jgi:hypothetical protein